MAERRSGKRVRRPATPFFTAQGMTAMAMEGSSRGELFLQFGWTRFVFCRWK